MSRVFSDVSDLLRDPADLSAVNDIFAARLDRQMPQLSIRTFGAYRARFRRRVRRKIWTVEEYCRCVRFVTLLGVARPNLSMEELRMLNRGHHALQTLELAWCRHIQRWIELVPELPEIDHEFANRFRSLEACLEDFAFSFPGFRGPQAAEYLLALFVDELPPLVLSKTAEEMLSKTAEEMDSRLEFAIYFDNIQPFARAVQFLFSGLDQFDDGRLAESIGTKIRAELAALAPRDAVVDYYMSKLRTNMVLTQTERIHSDCYLMHSAIPERDGVLIAPTTEQRWTGFWMAILLQVNDSSSFYLEVDFGENQQHPDRGSFEEQLDRHRLEVLAIETHRRNLLRVRALRGAFPCARDDLASLVLEFLG